MDHTRKKLDDPSPPFYPQSMAVPSFYLYGEPHRAVPDDFVHTESLDDRSRPSEWTILPHAHADLVQVFVLASGGGTMQAEADSLRVAAPALLIVPAAIVHGFDWHPNSTGSVLTLSVRHLTRLDSLYPGLAAIFAHVAVLHPDAAAMTTVTSAMAALMRELGWAAPGHGAAVDAALLSILVAAMRAPGAATDDPAAAPGYHHALVARFRARIDERFRLREPMSSHAAALGTSESRLRTACAKVAALSPAAMLDQRAMLEVRRALLYTHLSVAEIGYAVGFADPAYFSRFFTRHEGCSPRAFRDARGTRPHPAGPASPNVRRGVA